MEVNQHLTTAVVDGQPIGVWDKKSGGDVDSSETKYKPGGMAPEVSLGGTITTGNITLERLLDLERGDFDLIRFLMSRAGKGRMTVSEQPLDPDGNPFGRPLIYRGVLKTVNPGDVDSNATGARLFSLVMSSDGQPG